MKNLIAPKNLSFKPNINIKDRNKKNNNSHEIRIDVTYLYKDN